MKSRWMPVLVVALLAAQVGAEELQAPATELGKRSYAAGVDMGKALARQGVELDSEALVAGIRDVLTKSPLRMTDTELQASLNALQTELKLQRARPLQMVADRNKSEGATFLEKNKKAPGVVTLPSGVQYLVLTEGKGKLPKDSDTVTCNYKGQLLDGTEFDNSYRRGQPADLSLKLVVPGLREALQKMPAGSTWRIWVPYQLGYGEKGMVPQIQPYATLTFDLELLAVKS